MEFGLTDKEASVYVALLELGPSSVQDVSSKSGAHRSTSYAVLESLRARGLINTEEEERRTRYVPVPPETLMQLLEEEQRQIRDKMDKIQLAMPMFRAMYNSAPGKPTVRFFDGEDGIAEARSILLEHAEGELLSFCSVDASLHRLANIEPRQREQATRRLSGRCLYATAPGVELPTYDQRNWIMKKIPLAEMPFTGEINIIGSVIVAIVVQDSPMAFVVEHPMMAQLFRAIFETAWRGV